MLKQYIALGVFLILCSGLVLGAPPTDVLIDLTMDSTYEMDTVQYVKVMHDTDDVTDYASGSIECYAHIEDANEKVLYRFFDKETVCVTESCQDAETIEFELHMDANLTHAYDFYLDSKVFETDTIYTTYISCTDFEVNETFEDSEDFNAVTSNMTIESDLSCNSDAHINNNLYCEATLKDFTYSETDSYCNIIYKESGEIRKTVEKVPYNKGGYLLVEDKIDLIFGELDYSHNYTIDASCYDSTSKKLDLTQDSFEVKNLRPNDNFLVPIFAVLDSDDLMGQIALFGIGAMVSLAVLGWIFKKD